MVINNLGKYLNETLLDTSILKNTLIEYPTAGGSKTPRLFNLLSGIKKPCVYSFKEYCNRMLRMASAFKGRSEYHLFVKLLAMSENLCFSFIE